VEEKAFTGKDTVIVITLVYVFTGQIRERGLNQGIRPYHSSEETTFWA